MIIEFNCAYDIFTSVSEVCLFDWMNGNTFFRKVKVFDIYSMEVDRMGCQSLLFLKEFLEPELLMLILR